MSDAETYERGGHRVVQWLREDVDLISGVLKGNFDTPADSEVIEAFAAALRDKADLYWTTLENLVAEAENLLR